MISRNSVSLSIKPSSVISLLQLLFAIFIFYSIANIDFFRSYDSEFYYRYFDVLNSFSILELHEQARMDSIYPYLYINNYDIEFGFVYISKIISILVPGGSEYSYAFLAALSFFLRYLVLQRMNVPVLLGTLINLYALSLFELNALRVGVATTFLLFSLFNYSEKNYAKSIIFVLLALAIHTQIAIYVFILSIAVALNYLTKYYRGIINQYLNLSYGLLIGSALTIAIPFLASRVVKLDAYFNIYTQATGFGITNVISLLIGFLVLFSIKKDRTNITSSGSKIFLLATCSTFITFSMLLLLTISYGTVSQRAFQVGFVVFSSTVCSKYYINKINVRFRNIGIAILCIVLNVNVFIRYPTNNLIAPPLPAFIDLRSE